MWVVYTRCERRMLIVIKVGGSILGEGVHPNILDDLKAVASTNKVILVHGGGKEVTEVAEKMGKEQKFVVSPEGIRSRYTDWETVVIYNMVMSGKMNKEIVTTLQRVGIPAVGLSGVDGGLIRAERKKKLIIVDERGRKRIIDGGYTGKIKYVDAALLNLLLERNYLPVISPVALGDEYEFLNLDGDRAAAYIAGGVKADKVIFLTDVQGLILEGKLVEKISAAEAKNLLPKIGFGMEKKVLAALEALQMGVKESIIASGLTENPISTALKGERCTVIYSG